MNDSSTNWFAVLAVAVVMPLVGLWAGNATITDLNRQAQSAIGVNMAQICELNESIGDAGIARFCSKHQTAGFLMNLSIGTLIAGLALVFGFKGLASWAGANRERNAAAFPIAVPSALLLLGAIAIAQAAIAVIALVNSGFGGRLLVFIAIGAIVAVVALIAALIAMSRRPSHWELAIEPSREESRSLVGLVSAVAERVGARVPDRIIVGLQPNFYATGAEVKLPGESRAKRGETLYLSLPLMRVLRRDEIEAIVGHELGHFKGSDTAYTLRFAPLYAGMSRAVQAMEAQKMGFIQTLARMPAQVISRFLLSVFALNERQISRDREFEADRVGAQASSPQALGSGLLKLTLFSRLWPNLRSLNIEAAKQGVPPQNVSPVFATMVVTTPAEEIGRGLESALRERQVHPMDTHPPTVERLEALDVDPAGLTIVPGGSWVDDSEVRSELEGLEEQVTVLEYAVLRQAVSSRAA